MAGAAPLLAAAGASAVFLALAQAIFFLLRNRDFLEPEMAAGLTKFSVLLSAVTVLLLLPIAAFARRFLPAWRSGDRLGASWELYDVTRAHGAEQRRHCESGRGGAVPPAAGSPSSPPSCIRRRARGRKR